ncbi:endonuclease NucS domain-containing protein [Bacillus alkalisoli]|uniref:endonuclease NucS domain-containing protein n=1 Tax=Bacillus alkalisoli TaxID=2011008 RepID=UPI000C24F26A|nr:endonuclease NucS domain-containing protein [Bacillus alkalisoli]
MHILTEREMEDVLALHPELIEKGLTLISRQAQLETRRTDLTFSDKEGKLLLIELKKRCCKQGQYYSNKRLFESFNVDLGQRCQRNADRSVCS